MSRVILIPTLWRRPGPPVLVRNFDLTNIFKKFNFRDIVSVRKPGLNIGAAFTKFKYQSVFSDLLYFTLGRITAPRLTCANKK